jgi:hypothetical protein
MNERIVATSTSTGKKFCLQHELLLQLVKEKREKRMQVELVREGKHQLLLKLRCRREEPNGEK